jgi:hypothetical protein
MGQKWYHSTASYDLPISRLVLFFNLKSLGPLNLKKRFSAASVAEPEPHHFVGAGAVTRCGSGSDNGIKHG